MLAKYGLFPRMEFTFSGMVGHGVALEFPPCLKTEGDITDGEGKTYLTVTCDGVADRDDARIGALTRKYVAFSGHNFPHILVPLMEKHGVMINPVRPLVIYESMSFDLEHGRFVSPILELEEATLEVNGRRGDVAIHFRISEDGETVGMGLKRLVLSGLRPYNDEGIKGLIDYYHSRRA